MSTEADGEGASVPRCVSRVAGPAVPPRSPDAQPGSGSPPAVGGVMAPGGRIGPPRRPRVRGPRPEPGPPAAPGPTVWALVRSKTSGSALRGQSALAAGATRSSVSMIARRCNAAWSGCAGCGTRPVPAQLSTGPDLRGLAGRPMGPGGPGSPTGLPEARRGLPHETPGHSAAGLSARGAPEAGPGPARPLPAAWSPGPGAPKLARCRDASAAETFAAGTLFLQLRP